MKVVFAVTMILLAGCWDMPDSSAWHYVSSRDHSVVVSRPDWEVSRKIGSDWCYPVRFSKRDGRHYRQTNVFWCKMTDRGSSGNYRVETSDGSFVLEDYNYCNSGDPEAIYTSVTMKKDGGEVMIPLECNFELNTEE